MKDAGGAHFADGLLLCIAGVVSFRLMEDGTSRTRTNCTTSMENVSRRLCLERPSGRVVRTDYYASRIVPTPSGLVDPWRSACKSSLPFLPSLPFLHLPTRLFVQSPCLYLLRRCLFAAVKSDFGAPYRLATNGTPESTVAGGIHCWDLYDADYEPARLRTVAASVVKAFKAWLGA